MIGSSLEDQTETVQRAYCDGCIKAGVEIFVARGLMQTFMLGERGLVWVG
jgi:hypothetical protein